MFDKLVDLFIQFIKIFQFTLIIAPWQRAIRLRLGKFHSVLQPGLHFFFPFWIDRIVGESVVTETMDIKPQSLTTKDGKTVVITAVITFKIEDIRTFLLDVEGRNNAVEDSTYGAISSYVMKKTWGELVELEDLGNELTKTVRRLAKKYGVDIISVQIMDFIQCRPLRLITSNSAPIQIQGS